ncbi:MAG: hypothetical protein WC566_10225 [Dehalococcoidia bacterium]
MAIGIIGICECTKATATTRAEIQDTRLDDAYIGEYYSTKLRVIGGIPPYQFYLVAGTVAPGLSLGIDGAINGTPQSGSTSSNFTFTVRVIDSTKSGTDKLLSLSMFYRADISISSTLCAGTTSVSVDGRPVEVMTGGQTMSPSPIFTPGTTHFITVDSKITDPTDNLTVYEAARETIWISDTAREAKFNYQCRYRIDLVTEPPEVSNSFPFQWYRTSGWYDKGNTISYSLVPKQVSSYISGKEYRFSKWQLPDGDTRNEFDLSWKAEHSGQVVAVFDTYYKLAIITQFGAKIEGARWYKAGEQAHWVLYSPEEPHANGMLGWIMNLKPQQTAGTVLMNGPKEIYIKWIDDCTGLIQTIVIGLVILIPGTLVAMAIANRIKRSKGKLREYFTDE